MRKALHIIAFAAVAIAALASCAKEEFKENAIPAGEPIEVSLNGLIGDFTPADATKATAESVVRVTWGSGDKVYVYDGGNASIGTLTVTPDNNNASYAMLSGTITASSASPSKLTLVYVKGATEAPAISGGKISVDLSSQNQTEVPFVLYTTVAYDADALTKTNEYISFTFATSVMTVNCTGLQTGASGAVTGIDKAEIDGVSTACELTIDGTGVTAVAGITPGKITRTEITGTGASVFTQSDSRGSFRLALAADPAAPAARNILVHQGSKVSGSPFTSATLAAGKSYNTVYQMGEYISNEPDGKLSGGFTVDAQGKKVYFSKGNLQATYNGSSYAWDFAANQYSCVGNAAGNTSIDSQTNGAVVDLFGWSTSSTTYGINTSNETSTYSGEFVDWGKAYCEKNSIAVGTWRTLSIDEWTYLFNTRSNASNLYKCGVTVCGKTNCVVLLPDNWDETVISLTNFAALNTCDESSNPKWSEMQAAGAVCLPAAGFRYGPYVIGDGDDYDDGRYWSSAAFGEDYAFYVYFSSDIVYPVVTESRYNGFSVRLVTESAADGGYAPVVKVTGVTISKEETSILVGDKEPLAATVAPANATNKQVIWSSSKPSVATVDATSGEVTGVAKGSANIFATTADGNFIAVCLVTVTPKPLPAGALKGEFSVSATKKVNFSQGNLTYNVSTSTWAFYEHQYDCATAYDANLISLFTWGYSASTSLNPTGDDYVTAHPDDGDKLVYDKASSEGGDDWGVAYCESNNIMVGTWRTLSIAEWHYLFYTRTMTNEKSRYTLNITYSGKMGVVLYPDDYAGSELSGTVNSLPEGVVFLPAVGQRSFGSNVDAYFGSYWSSTSGGSDLEYAYRVYFGSDYLGVGGSYNDYRGNGYSVRLVTE